MGTITLTSILAFNQVHVEEYVIVTPLVAIISGRGICEMLKISKNFCIELLILSLLIVLIFLSTYSDINFLIKRNVSVCIIHLPELAQILNQTNFTVKGEQTMFHNALKWYGAKAKGCGIFDSEKGEPTVQKEIETLIQNNEKVLYVFQSPECSHYPKFQEKFVEKVNSYNKSIIKEIVNFGEINYTIYQVR
jgi:thioredoxin-related protein